MHSFGIATNGSTEEPQPTNSENGLFSNGDVNSGGTSNGTDSVSVSNNTNGVVNSYTNGADKDDDDDDSNGAYMNGNSHTPPKKSSTFVVQSDADRDIIRLIGQQLIVMGLE